MSRFLKRYKPLIIFYLVLSTIFVFADFFSSSRVLTQKVPTRIATNFSTPMTLNFNSSVLAATSTPVLSTPIPTPTPTPVPTPTPIRLSKNSYQIAAIGDSMVETMGGNLEYLLGKLKAKYPGTNFNMYNYGKGAENVVAALERFDTPYSYKDRSYYSINDIKPDVIIIGSWAYNPLTNTDISVYKDSLTSIINKAKNIGSKVYLLAEIAPLHENFGVGVGGVNWPPEIASAHAEKITNFMAAAKGLAKPLGVGLIDVYSRTTLPGSPFGRQEFVDPHDNIHPSVYGHTFMAQIITSTIKLD